MSEEEPPRRQQTYKVPKRDWIHRNPRLFIVTTTTVSLLIFFSKPIYDCFFCEKLPPLEKSRKF